MPCPDADEFSLLYVWGSRWLHFASPKFLFLPTTLPRNIQSKNEGDLPLNSPVEEKKWFSVPFLDSLTQGRHGAASDLRSCRPLCASFFRYTLICLGHKQISDMTSVCWLFPPRDLTVHFFLGRARVSFKSFSSGFLRNLSVWHVCHFSRSSSPSWQSSRNGICWQVVRADSEYVWKTVKLVKKKIKERASLHLKQHVKL